MFKIRYGDAVIEVETAKEAADVAWVIGRREIWREPGSGPTLGTEIATIEEGLALLEEERRRRPRGRRPRGRPHA